MKFFWAGFVIITLECCGMSIENSYLVPLKEKLAHLESENSTGAATAFLIAEIYLLTIIVQQKGQPEMTLNAELLPQLTKCGVFTDLAFEEKVDNLIKATVEQHNERLEVACCCLLSCGWDKKDMGKLVGECLIRSSGINRQSVCGKTLLMMVADGERIDHLSYYAFKKEPTIVKNITAACKMLLDHGASVVIADDQGQTVLHIAVAALNLPLCVLLIERGANPKAVDLAGRRPYHKLINYYSWRLGEKFGRIASAGMAAPYGQAICRIFWEKGETPDSVDCHKNTVLHRAVSAGDIEMIEWLLRKGCGVNCKNTRNQTPLHISCIRQVSYVSQLLINSQARQNTADVFGNMPIHYASLNDCLNLFLDPKYKDEAATENSAGWNILHLACMFNNIEGVSTILQNNIIDVNSRTSKSGKTPLMIACEKGYPIICKLLLAQPNLDPSVPDEHVGSALDWACEFGDTYICKLLLKCKFSQQSERAKAKLLRRACLNDTHELIDVFFIVWRKWDGTDEEGNTVMHIACLEGYGNVVELLLQNISPKLLGFELKNKGNKTPFACAREQAQYYILEQLHAAQIFS